MDFLFHSVYNGGPHAKYYNVYKVDENHFVAECHHFNRSRECEGDFEIIRDPDGWKTNNEKYEQEAQYIGEEIDRGSQ